jgi:transcriptional regulator with XRE-family HTH domain
MAADEPHEQLGHAIQELRVRRGLTQREVALSVGMRSEQFARYERGDVRNPLLSTITRIARGLGVSTADLLRCIA